MADPGRTEQATPRRRQEARERGQVVRSTEVNSVLIFFIALLIFKFAGSSMVAAITEIFTFTYQNMNVPINIENVHSYGLFYAIQTGRVLAPVILGLLAISLASNYLQVGVLFTTKPLIPKFKNINPATGFKRIFSKRSIVELAKAILKVALVGWVGYSGVKKALPQIIPTMDMQYGASFALIGSVTMTIMLRITFLLLVLALLDYMYQRWEYNQSLKMTRQEVKDEMRQMEGDPLIRARIRQIQREMARRRMFEAVPQANVVITNPTHVAVALQYKEEMHAPTVVAKGERVVAERIKEVAYRHQVPVVENPPLARALFKACPVGAPIPVDLYEAVAEVLAFVYRMNKQRASAAVSAPATSAGGGARPSVQMARS